MKHHETATEVPDDDEVSGALPYLKRSGFVYLMQAGSVYKIGRTTNLERRRRAIQTGSAVPVEIVACAFVNDAARLEAALHDEFAATRLSGEWFALDQRSVRDVVRLLDEAERMGQ